MIFHRNPVSLTAQCATHGTPVYQSATVLKLICQSVSQLELLSATPVTVVCIHVRISFLPKVYLSVLLQWKKSYFTFWKKILVHLKSLSIHKKGILSYMGKLKNLVITVIKTGEIIKFLQNCLFQLNFSWFFMQLIFR